CPDNGFRNEGDRRIVGRVNRDSMQDMLDRQRSGTGANNCSRIDKTFPRGEQVTLEFVVNKLPFRAHHDGQVDTAGHLQPGIGRRDQHVGGHVQYVPYKDLDLHLYPSTAPDRFLSSRRTSRLQSRSIQSSPRGATRWYSQPPSSNSPPIQVARSPLLVWMM